jgi:hypothetical protein
MASVNTDSYLLDFIPSSKDGNVDISILIDNLTNELVKIKDSNK